MDAGRRRELIGKIRRFFPNFAERCLKIKTKSGQILPFILNRAQRYAHEKIEEQLKRTGKVRKVVLKGRQQGFSTYSQGRGYWKVTGRKGMRAYILTHEAEATSQLFSMAKLYHELCPSMLKPVVGSDSSKELSFPKLKSDYKVGTAGNRGSGRSQTFHYFHGSEVAFWPHADEHLAGALQALSNEDGTEGILESTANGVGGVFYDYVMDARAGEGEYELIFIPWYWQEEYVSPVPADFERTDEERKLALLVKHHPDGAEWSHTLTDEQLQWRRKKIYELKSLDKFKQEYPCHVMEAFLFSGRPAFDPNDTAAAKENCYRFKYIYDLAANKLEPSHKKQFQKGESTSGYLLVWEKPKPDMFYAIGADVAEGLEHGDDSWIDVADKDGYQVARFKGHPDPDIFAGMLNQVGRWYNNALLGVERNNHGHAVIGRLKPGAEGSYNYPNLYVEEDTEHKSDKRRKRYGWHTNAKTKPLMIDYLNELLRDEIHGIVDAEAVDQCQTYVIEDNGSTNAQAGCKDDGVIATAICRQMVKRLPKIKRAIPPSNYTPGKAGYA
ncbi:hypothetical protein [Kistimonas asteriae]|uniref:hypothetical protein n=1 Tax=Kistimonas asteriae TaxID=517724 RepID=UPI001BA73B56|nr:hypothetical protein [Kistimonas asteriae]